ncbi:hypothetical protein OE88DRAFT_1214160 [Heliocybe sulcata]|uniref:Uncharacterized protein n=1 Tax=Heliocybe sulcata TaxID=5364 RepID=A0A5C3MLA6_9AGAM|nr:hypothetical protein OE88DRAFT_1214160 [Heliocybe sulcata]
MLPPHTMPSTDDLSILELRGPAIEWLGPGGRITIGDVEYEYADSEADDDSIDDAVGPGRMFGKLVKRVAAPLEMFFSVCSDLLGNGPDATFTKIMRRDGPWVKEYRRTRRLSWWLNMHEHIVWLPSPVGRHIGEVGRLVQFVIDRRYSLSVRLTAAYYLVLIMAQSFLGDLPGLLPLIHDALLRLCLEGSRHGI